jgi:hypothetical protein
MDELLQCLRIPGDFMLDNRTWVNGQEGLLVMLRLMAYPTRLMDQEQFLGWEYSCLSRINNYMKQYIFDNHHHRLQNYLDWHTQYFDVSKAAFQARKRRDHPRGELYDRTKDVCQYFDGFRVHCCRPQAQQGVDANGMPVHLDIQALVYNGHEKV